MMGSRDFYSSLNEVQLNVKEINSLQIELSKKIYALKNKNILVKTNENKKYINPQSLDSKRPNLISNAEFNDVEILKFTQNNKVNNLNSKENEDLQFNKTKNNYDGIQIKNDGRTSKSKFKAINFNDEDDNIFSKLRYKIGDKKLLVLFILIWAALVLLCIVILIL